MWHFLPGTDTIISTVPLLKQPAAQTAVTPEPSHLSSKQPAATWGFLNKSLYMLCSEQGKKESAGEGGLVTFLRCSLLQILIRAQFGIYSSLRDYSAVHLSAFQRGIHWGVEINLYWKSLFSFIHIWTSKNSHFWHFRLVQLTATWKAFYSLISGTKYHFKMKLFFLDTLSASEIIATLFFHRWLL